jgi:hypothetical protein
MKMDTRLRGYDMYSDVEICKDSEYKDKFKTAKTDGFSPTFYCPATLPLCASFISQVGNFNKFRDRSGEIV